MCFCRYSWSERDYCSAVRSSELRSGLCTSLLPLRRQNCANKAHTAARVHLSVASNTLGIFGHSEQAASARVHSLEMSGHTKRYIKIPALLSAPRLVFIRGTGIAKKELKIFFSEIGNMTLADEWLRPLSCGAPRLLVTTASRSDRHWILSFAQSE